VEGNYRIDCIIPYTDGVNVSLLGVFLRFPWERMHSAKVASGQALLDISNMIGVDGSSANLGYVFLESLGGCFCGAANWGPSKPHRDYL
jgi:hypothetical protein